LIDAFSRWVELSPPRQRWHGNRHLAYFNIWDDSTHLNEKLFHGRCELSLTTAYSSEENGIVEGSNQEVLRHLNAILFDSRVHNKWSFEQLPMVQRIMNTVEKTSTGVTPAELILNNSIRLTERILLPPTQAMSSGQFALSDTMDDWIARQSILIKVARDKQLRTDHHALVEYDPTITEYPVHSYVLFTPPVGRSDKLLPRHRGPFQVLDRMNSIYTIEDLVSGKRSSTPASFQPRPGPNITVDRTNRSSS
jgi:hypothetical protein